MSIEQSIRSLIVAVPAVTSAVVDRVVPVGVPQRLPRPNIVYQLIGGRGIYSNDGPTGLKRATLQVSCYADDYYTAKGLATAIAKPSDAPIPGLDGYSGQVGAVFIQSLLIDDERDAPQPPGPGEGSGVAGVVVMFAIAYSG